MSKKLCNQSLIIPVYRNEENIGDLLMALESLNEALGNNLEVVFVIDGSPDRSGELLVARRGGTSFTSKIVFHSRNFGSFTAIRTGMEQASGTYIAVMAADLQEPPHLIMEFFRILQADEADIVFGKRISRNDAPLRDFFSNFFWTGYRKLVLKDVPRGGVDIFACNKTAALSVLEFSEPNSSLVAQLFWIGYRRSFVEYNRVARIKGKSGWGFTRRMRYMMDSIFSFTDLPILLVLWLGVVGCILSLGFGIGIAIARSIGRIDQPGYAALVVLITFSVSAILAAQGIIGSYLWRTFQNTKRRPLRIVSRIVE